MPYYEYPGGKLCHVAVVHILSCNNVTFIPLMVVQGGTGWWSTSLWLVDNMTWFTYRAPCLCSAAFFHHHSAFCFFNSGSNEYMYVWISQHENVIKECVSLFQHWIWVVDRNTYMKHWSLFNTCGINFAQIFCFFRCSIRKQNPLPGGIPTSTATGLYKMLFMHLSTACPTLVAVGASQ